MEKTKNRHTLMYACVEICDRRGEAVITGYYERGLIPLLSSW